MVDVTPPPSLNFEDAVRRADPSGHEAMAAAYYSSSTGDMLAVDTSRLAAVAFWPSELSREPLSALARQLSPPIPKGVSFTGSELQLTLTVPQGTPSMSSPSISLTRRMKRVRPSTSVRWSAVFTATTCH